MPRKKTGKKGGKDWDSIRSEWETGTLTKSLIAKTFGVSTQAIDVRRKRDEEIGDPWKERPGAIILSPAESAERVSVLAENSMAGGSGPMMQRFIRLVQTHRQTTYRVRQGLERLNDDIERFYLDKKGKPLRLDEIQSVARSYQSITNSFLRVVAIERKLIGIQDHEAPSEFDTMSNEELEDLAAIVIRRMGQ